MPASPRYSSLFQINTRYGSIVCRAKLAKCITLADIDDTTIDGFANLALIRANWSSCAQAGVLPPAERRCGGAARVGRLERTLFMLDWIDDPELRRDTGRELGRGEFSRISLARHPTQTPRGLSARFVRACCKMRRFVSSNHSALGDRSRWLRSSCGLTRLD